MLAVGNKAFSASPVPLEELKEFYKIDKNDLPKDRPYAWNIYVMSLTGIVTYLDARYSDPRVGLSGSGIALSHMKGKWPEASGSDEDYRCLNFGWSVADAVIAGASSVRVEHDLVYAPLFDDLIEYRTKELGKNRVPINVILTANGFNAEELKYPMFNSKDHKTLIATSEKGYKKMETEARQLPSTYKPMELSTFEVLGDERVDVTRLMRLLKSEHEVQLADLEGGPSLSNQFFLEKLVDEYRITISPVFINSLNEDGQQRFTPLRGGGFGPLDSPTGPVMGRRYYGDYTFIRTAVNYHH